MKTETLKVEMNQPVVMADGYRGKEVRHGKVTKIGRVWIEVLPDGWTTGNTYRFRLDTQTDGSQYSYGGRFYTLDQWAERERRNAADEFLREQGISINSGSLWRGREVELAELLKNASKPEEEQ